MEVTVYTKTVCQGCKMVKRYLKEHNVEYKEVNVDENEDAFNHIKSLGFTSLPVVAHNDGSGEQYMLGFNPPKLKEVFSK